VSQFSFAIVQQPSRKLQRRIGKMALASSALSRTLQSITATKISELEKQRKSFEVRKNDIFAAVEEAKDDHYERSRSRRLLLGVKELDPSSESESVIFNIQNSLYQSYYDPSIPVTMLQTIEAQLRSRLDAQSRRLSSRPLLASADRMAGIVCF
jgi:hypothetical protein